MENSFDDLKNKFLTLESKVRQFHLHVRKELKRRDYNDENKTIENEYYQLQRNFRHFYHIIDNFKWDYKSNKRFNYLNTILLIAPTLLGVAIIIYGVLNPVKETQQIEAIAGTEKPGNEYVKRLNTTIEELNDRILSLDNKIREKEHTIEELHKANFKPSSYLNSYYYELEYKSESIDLKKYKPDLLILKNISSTPLYLSTSKPNNIVIKDILNSWLTYDTIQTVNSGQALIISVDKLKYINENITLNITKPDLKVKPLKKLILKIK